jgi:hypothetical protein
VACETPLASPDYNGSPSTPLHEFYEKSLVWRCRLACPSGPICRQRQTASVNITGSDVPCAMWLTCSQCKSRRISRRERVLVRAMVHQYQYGIVSIRYNHGDFLIDAEVPSVTHYPIYVSPFPFLSNLYPSSCHLDHDHSTHLNYLPTAPSTPHVKETKLMRSWILFKGRPWSPPKATPLRLPQVHH